MGRELERENSGFGFESYHPGCMWGMLQILRYQHGHNLKKLSGRRRHGRGKHAICCGNPKTVSFDHYTDEVQKYLDAEAVPLLDEEPVPKTSPRNRFSGKSDVKAVISKERSGRLKLKQTGSFHDLQPSDQYCINGISADWKNPIIIIHKSAETATGGLQASEEPATRPSFSSENGRKGSSTALNRNLSDVKQLSRQVSSHQFKECADVLELFKVNKNIFLEILQDPGLQAVKSLRIEPTPNTHVRLRKSGSFPAANSSHVKFGRPRTLEDKQKETWSFSKGERLITKVQAPKSAASNSFEDFNENSRYLKVDDSEATTTVKETSLSSVELPQRLHKHGWHQSFKSYLKDIKKKIKHALKESRKGNKQSSTDATLHIVPSGSELSNDEEESESLKRRILQQDGATNSSDNDLNTDRVSSVRRSSSLSESVDRYARLFDFSFSREAKWHRYQSKSLRLTNEDKFQSSGHTLKSFGRRLSLPDLDSIIQIPIEDSHEAFHSGIAIRNSMGSDPADRMQLGPLDAIEEIAPLENMEETVSSEENKSSCSIADTDAGIAETDEEPCPAAVDEAFVEHTMELMEFAVSTGPELEQDPKSMRVDDAGSSLDLQDRSARDSSAGCSSTASSENAENASTLVYRHPNYIDLTRFDDPDFKYIRDVLDTSGFAEEDYLVTWHSLDQPIAPELFKELEAYIHQELDWSLQNTSCNCDHHLLFDLINDQLLGIFQSSLAYFPKSLPFTRRTRPLPKGNHVVEEVWQRIRWHRNSRSAEQSLDDIVGRDLAKDDDWMNLQLDAEDVALDLEDLIFDQLLDEVLCS